MTSISAAASPVRMAFVGDTISFLHEVTNNAQKVIVEEDDQNYT